MLNQVILVGQVNNISKDFDGKYHRIHLTTQIPNNNKSCTASIIVTVPEELDKFIKIIYKDTTIGVKAYIDQYGRIMAQKITFINSKTADDENKSK